MRLLFIYFYKTKGTFKEGTTIELSKKYSVTDNGFFITLKKSKNLKWSIYCKKLTLRDYQYQYYEFCTKFNFLLTENDSFQDDFYGDSIDIGAIIGENGMGKSVLINSLRDKDNDYSLAVYENKKGFIYSKKSSIENKKIIIDNKEINEIQVYDGFSKIYYSPTQDTLYRTYDDTINISDSVFSKSFENREKNLIEDSDLKNYLNMENRTIKNYVKLDYVKFERNMVSIYQPQKFAESLQANIKINREYLNRNNTLEKFKLIYEIYKLMLHNFYKSDIKLLICLNSIMIDDNITNIVEIHDFIEERKKISAIQNKLFLEENDILDLINLLDKKFNIVDKNMKNLFDIIEISEYLSVGLDESFLRIPLEKLKEVNFTKYVDNYIMKPFRYELYPPLSSGQKAILFIFARIDNAIKQIKSKNITILLDEADLKLHLEWQRQFINDLVEFLKNYTNKNFYVLYATHSPMILSDITDDRIVFLKKEGDYSIDKSINEKKSTFGANIYDLYHDSFFMDRYMGEFAFNTINDVINIVNLYTISKENKSINYRDSDVIKIFRSYKRRYNKPVESDCNKVQQMIEKDKDKLEQIAEKIGEPLLRNKLLRDIRAIGGYNENKVINALKNMSPKNRKDELSKHSKQRQIELLTKLLDEGDSNDKC